MARQKGLVIIKGTFDGLNFYLRKGEPLVRKSGGGFTSKAIKSKPSMIRVRENGSEFGRCMVAVKHFKIALFPLLTLFKDGKRHQRLVQLFTQIKQCDSISERGKRSVGAGMQTDAGRALFAKYVFSSGSNLSAILGHSFHFEWSVNGFTVSDFSTSSIQFPKGATHIELIVGWLAFDFATYDYSFYKSDFVLISKESTQTSLQIPPTELPLTEGARIGIVFMRFAQEINNVSYPFKEAERLVMEVVYLA